MYRIQHVAYCGMPDVPACFNTSEEAREYAAERLRRYRRHYPVTTLKRGAKWEILERDDSVMVSDSCGVLSLEHVTYECWECGFAHDSREDTLRCCRECDE